MNPNECFEENKIEPVVFMRWINFVLQSCGRSNSINNIHSDLCDGVILLDVLECITGKQMNAAHRSMTLHEHKIENILLIQQFLEDENVELVTDICKYDIHTYLE